MWGGDRAMRVIGRSDLVVVHLLVKHSVKHEGAVVHLHIAHIGVHPGVVYCQPTIP